MAVFTALLVRLMLIWDIRRDSTFETMIYAKRNAARVLSDELDKPGYRPETIVLGANTDPYQPIERRQEITRDILTVLLERKHPVSITTEATSILETSISYRRWLRIISCMFLCPQPP